MRILSVTLTLAIAACRTSSLVRPLRLGTTTTVQQSGMLAMAESLWRGARLATVVGPSGQILRSAAQGDLDVVLTHAPALETKFLTGGVALARCPFLTSQFAIVGPARDPAGVSNARTAAEAFGRIATRQATFVSRGDSSGTHERELALWHAAGVSPDRQHWYLQSGTDQTTTLRLADERGAYALADRPSLATLPDLALRPLFSDDTALLNRYALTLIRTPEPHPAARVFFTWALDTWRPSLLAMRLPDRTPAFARPPRSPERLPDGSCPDSAATWRP